MFLTKFEQQQLIEYCQTLAIPVQFQYVEQLASSNSELLHLAKTVGATNRLLMANKQTAGRGRNGKTWLATNSSGALTFSLGLTWSQANIAGLSLALGVALAQALDPAIQVKWPNDLFLANKKLAGILIELINLRQPAPTALQQPSKYLVIGVGINLSSAALPGELNAIGLDSVTAAVDNVSLIKQILTALINACIAFICHGFSDFKARYQQIDFLFAKQVKLTDGTVGVAKGVTDLGQLIVQNKSRTSLVMSDEVSVIFG